MKLIEKQFSFDINRSKSNDECIFKGNKYRITVLTKSLLRLEYNENGIFNDNPTELVFYRNFNKPEFEVEQTDRILKIKTAYFTLMYSKEKQFKGTTLNPSSNLMVKTNKTEKVWYYNHHEVRNYPYSAFILDKDSSSRVSKSLFSLDGFCSIDDSSSKVFDENGSIISNRSESIDIYLFMYDDNFKVCLSDYLLLTGRPSLIPRYALGLWWSKNDIYNNESLNILVNDFKRNNVPISIILLNKFWHNCISDNTKYLDTGFTFNSQLFPNPRETVNLLHSLNIKLGLTINPFEGIYPNENNYSLMKETLQADQNGVIPFNIFNFDLIDKYFNNIIYNLNNMGIDFYFISFFDIKRKSELTLLKHYHFFDYYKALEKRPLVYGYNSTVASHRYPVLYAGNATVSWQSLKQIPLFNSSNANMAICFISHSIGGYNLGVEDNELFTRYVQLGVFSPILNLSSESGKFYKREPWRWGIKTSKITTDYINLRYKLIPYIYSESYNYIKTGISILEPIYYQYPDIYDDPIYNKEYYFGRQLLISPITTKKDFVMNRVIQKTFLPEGTWYDFFTGKKYKGNKKHISFYKDEDYPVFAKEGSIIPLSLNSELNDTSVPKNMELLIFPGKSNSYNLYEDDGISNKYLNNEYLITNIEYLYEKDNYKLTIRPVEGKVGIIEEYRNYKITFKNTRKCDRVVVYLSNKQINYTSYNSINDFVIQIDNVSTSNQLTLLIGGKDIEISALRIVKDDLISILEDLPIETFMKEKADKIMFSTDDIKHKRINIRKLGHEKKYLEKKYVELFLKLLEYMDEI